MKIFLVRHAESSANALNIHGGAESGLSQTGIKQAELVAKRFIGVNVDLILCSRYKRAMQTADVIASFLNKRVVHTNLLNEWRYPSEMKNHKVGKSRDSKIWNAILKNCDNPKWHYSDEENITDLKKRAGKVFEYLKSKNEGSVVVITHGAFMGVLMGFALFGKDAAGAQILRAHRFFVTANAGITELELRKDGEMKLITFNDYTHLK